MCSQLDILNLQLYTLAIHKHLCTLVANGYQGKAVQCITVYYFVILFLGFVIFDKQVMVKDKKIGF